MCLIAKRIFKIPVDRLVYMLFIYFNEKQFYNLYELLFKIMNFVMVYRIFPNFAKKL